MSNSRRKQNRIHLTMVEIVFRQRNSNQMDFIRIHLLTMVKMDLAAGFQLVVVVVVLMIHSVHRTQVKRMIHLQQHHLSAAIHLVINVRLHIL